MTTTPPSPGPSHQNALTEFSATPIRLKTGSVPLDGRVFKATTLDAELTTELEDATISERAQGSKDSYALYWCQLAQLDGGEHIKARSLRTIDSKPLFLDDFGYWDPSFIPHILRHPASEFTSATASGSKKRRKSQSNLRRDTTRQSTAKPNTATTSAAKWRSMPSIRREAITRNIPNTDLEETVLGTLIPLAGSEETDVATWLNRIISSFAIPPDSQSNSGSQLGLEGWSEPRLTRSALKKKRETLSAPHAHPRVWSAQYATKPVENSHMTIKPDTVFCGELDPRAGFTWRNVISFLELTSLPYSAQLRRDITRKAYAVFMSQPSRRFVIAISLAGQEFRLHLFDRSGAIHTLGHNIHKSADLFTRIVYTFAFAKPNALGFDPTFMDPTLSPSIMFRPYSSTAIKKSWTINVRGTAYTVLRHIFVSHLIRGRATSSWLVKRGDELYVVKDYWTHKGRKHAEEEILYKLKGLLGVPHLVDAWTVQAGGVDETTDLLRPAFLVEGLEFETRVHRRLLMTPVGEPVTQFSSLKELVSIFIDIVHVHFVLVDVYGILHRDISVNNILRFACTVRWPATSADEQKREDTIESMSFRRGLLIDYDYAEMLNAGKQGVSSGHRTGTIPFMAIDLLQEYLSPRKDFTHTFSHDLESLVYVLVWICVLYESPGVIRTDKTIEQTFLKQWALAKTATDIQLLCDQKIGQLNLKSDTVLQQVTPYFEPLKPTITRLYKLIRRSLDRDPDDEDILTHAAVTEILMDAFKTVEDLDEYGVKNAKRTWQHMQSEPVLAPSDYYSEGRKIRHKAL